MALVLEHIEGVNTIQKGQLRNENSNMKETAVSGRLMEIIVDDRESNAGVLEHLQSVENATVTVRRLPLGDYLIEKRLLFERKSFNDVAASIIDDLVPLRPNRSEPRAVKRRPKNYYLLNKPRHRMGNLPHRNRLK